jgi:hypothetical protein
MEVLAITRGVERDDALLDAAGYTPIHGLGSWLAAKAWSVGRLSALLR